MEINIESIIFYILLIDAIVANLIAWNKGNSWWHKNLPGIARYFPLSRGWTSYYIFLVLLMGIMLYRLDALVLPLY